MGKKTLKSERTANHLLLRLPSLGLRRVEVGAGSERWRPLTQLVVVDFHGGVGQRAEDGDDGDFPDGHFTHRLQVLVPLLHIHPVLLAGGRDQLEGGREVVFTCRRGTGPLL